MIPSCCRSSYAVSLKAHCNFILIDLHIDKKRSCMTAVNTGLFPFLNDRASGLCVLRLCKLNKPEMDVILWIKSTSLSWWWLMTDLMVCFLDAHTRARTRPSEISLDCSVSCKRCRNSAMHNCLTWTTRPVPISFMYTSFYFPANSFEYRRNNTNV